MRQAVDAPRLRQFMRELGRAATAPGTVYLTGGASAVLHEWRGSTIDVDIDLDAGGQAVLRDIPALKDRLQINVELAAPSQFIPEVPGWRDRSPFIVREGTLNFHHYDFTSQALSKIERGHRQDVVDVREMAKRGLITAADLRLAFETIRAELYRYPAIDPPTFERAVMDTVEELARG